VGVGDRKNSLLGGSCSVGTFGSLASLQSPIPCCRSGADTLSHGPACVSGSLSPLHFPASGWKISGVRASSNWEITGVGLMRFLVFSDIFYDKDGNGYEIWMDNDD
jgi:hypothetical protein